MSHKIRLKPLSNKSSTIADPIVPPAPVTKIFIFLLIKFSANLKSTISLMSTALILGTSTRDIFPPSKFLYLFI